MQHVRSKWRRSPLVLAMLGSTLVSSYASHAQTLGERKEFPSWAETSTKVGSAGNSQKISIAMFLGFRNEAALKDLITDVSSPGGVRYGKFLNTHRFDAQ